MLRKRLQIWQEEHVIIRAVDTRQAKPRAFQRQGTTCQARRFLNGAIYMLNRLPDANARTIRAARYAAPPLIPLPINHDRQRLTPPAINSHCERTEGRFFVHHNATSNASRSTPPCAASLTLACSGEILARAVRMAVLTSFPADSKRLSAASISSPVACRTIDRARCRSL